MFLGRGGDGQGPVRGGGPSTSPSRDGEEEDTVVGPEDEEVRVRPATSPRRQAGDAFVLTGTARERVRLLLTLRPPFIFMRTSVKVKNNSGRGPERRAGKKGRLRCR
jgi:hypothetical protein